MATTEKVKCPCKPATVEYLDSMLESVDHALPLYFHAVSFREIDWSNLRHLRKFHKDSSVSRTLRERGIRIPYYQSRDGSWLLAIDSISPEEYLNRCSPCLQSLWVRGFSGRSKLPNLEKYPQLTVLNLRGCRSLAELTGLSNLTKLTKLDLSYCEHLNDLPGLENLEQLTKLDPSGCTRLTGLPELKNLSQLTELYLLGCHSLTELPGLENLMQLTRLDLTGCYNLTELPGLENLKQLTELTLRSCVNLTELPSLRGLASLRSLNLRSMNLRSLPDWLPEIAESFSLAPWFTAGKNKAAVNLCNTTVKDIKDMSIFEQPFDMVVEWFNDQNKVPLNEVKVVFLGDGEAGKSHTIARLMNDGGEPVNYTDQATPGIVIKHKDYEVDGRTFRVNYWDFGGQEIMHSMHRIFLTGRTMYVVLLNARDDTQSDRAKYWLHNIQSFAPDAPVLLVLNKIDQNPNASVDERDLRGRCEKLTKVVRLSAKKFSQEAFNKEFTDVLKHEIMNTGFLDAA